MFPSLLCSLCWLAASLWLSKIGQVEWDSGASLVQFDSAAGRAESDRLIKPHFSPLFFLGKYLLQPWLVVFH